MATSKQNSEMFKKMRDLGRIRKMNPDESPQQQPLPKSMDIPFTPVPDIPTYPNAPNPRLRTPLPSVVTLQPDNVRQFFNPAVPQSRLLPNIPGGNAFLGSAIQSVSSTPVTKVVTPPIVNTDQLFEVNGNSATLGHILFINGFHT